MNSKEIIGKIKRKKVICFGASDAAKKFLESTPLLEVQFFIDNDKNKQGLVFQGYPICSPDILMKVNSKDYFIIITSQYIQEMKIQLNEFGLIEGKDFCSYIEVKNSLNSNLLFENGHFYSPIPDISEIQQNESILFLKDKKINGVNLNEDDQLKLFEQFKPLMSDFYQLLQEGHLTRYYRDNGYFEFFDAATLYSILSHFRPKRIIEVGSGFSSSVMLDAKDHLGHETNFTFIEPFPDRLNKLLTTSDQKETTIIVSKVQEVSLEIFNDLESGDILFIDSSHVSKIASDVNYILFDIIPSLKPGVLIHFHDIFYPFEYPKEWIYKGFYWNEAYLLRSFLQYNDTFKTIFWNDYIYRNQLHQVPKEYLELDGSFGGGLWLSKNK